MRTEVQKRGHYHWSPMGCTQVGCGGGVVMGVSSQQLLASPLHPLTAIMNADVDSHKNKLRPFLSGFLLLSTLAPHENNSFCF